MSEYVWSEDIVANKTEINDVHITELRDAIEDLSLRFSTLLTSHNALLAYTKSLIKRGTIMVWTGTIASIPAGFTLCNGLNGTPNMVGLFVLGTVTESEIGYIGGTQASSVGSTAYYKALYIMRTSYVDDSILPADI